MQQDFGFDLGDETHVTIVGVQGKIPSHASYTSSVPSVESRRSKHFHIRVIIKHMKVDTLFLFWYPSEFNICRNCQEDGIINNTSQETLSSWLTM